MCDAQEPIARPTCWCETCRPITMDDMRMVLCPTCGNKRCPHATNHRNACTSSNEVGQKGSSWEHVKPIARDPLVKIEPLGGDQVSITPIGTRNAIREVLGAPDSTMDLISELTQALIFALNTGKLTTGEQAVLMAALLAAGVEWTEAHHADR